MDHYTCIKTKAIDEINVVLKIFEHKKSGAKILHLTSDDPENIFCLSFNTYPEDSTGVAHILEHTVLCGSKNYPIRDPFFCMMRRSLNTFMNAFTGPDFTSYPAASQVEKDFYNLLDVYVDAAFYPLLNPLSFKQEGHRLEFQNPEDPTSPLIYKGIVFNEMKGALASADARIGDEINRLLLPDLTYHYISGGDPKDIPNLTYEEFKAFHNKFYHPSRCLFYFYGNIPIEKHLNYLHERILKNIEKSPPIPPIPKQARFEKPKHHIFHYPTSEKDLSKKTFITFSWLTCSLHNQEDVLALTLLDSILMDSDASPLRKALLDTKLCTHVDGYIDTEMSEIPYTIVCRGSEKEHQAPLERILQATLMKFVNDGIDKHLVDAALHQLMFQRLEITGDHYPYGLNLFFRSALPMQHGVDPEEGLKIHSLFNHLKKSLQDPNYLTNLIEKYFINNTHFLSMASVPDSSLLQKESHAEQTLLNNLQSKLSEEDKKRLVKQAKQLEDFQNKDESKELTCLPKLALSDVCKKAKDYPLNIKNQEKISTYHHSVFTNDIDYLSLNFPLAKIAQEELPYLQLMLSLFNEVGASKYSYIDVLQDIQMHTGGIYASVAMHQKPDDSLLVQLQIRAKALADKRKHLCRILRTQMLNIRFDEKARIQEVILQIYTYLQQKIQTSPMGFAVNAAMSSLSTASNLQYHLSGLPYFYFIKRLAENIKNIDPVLTKLEELKQKVFHGQQIDFVLSANDQAYSDYQSNNFYDLYNAHEESLTPFQPKIYEGITKATVIPISTKVAFTARAHKVPTFSDPDSSYIQLAAELFGNKILHKRIREQGGAYGGGAQYHPYTGTFHFFGYRDPHIASTVKAFDEAIEISANAKFDERDLEEAKFSLLQDLDAPISPGSRAMTAYAWHKKERSYDMRDEHRNRILHATKKDLSKAIRKAFIDIKQNPILVSFAGEELLHKEKAKLKQNLDIQSLLS